MWAYGMVIYCILNPDAKFPFYFDAKEARESWVGPERFDVLAFLEENIPKQKKTQTLQQISPTAPNPRMAHVS
jgi:hypothetical protein